MCVYSIVLTTSPDRSSLITTLSVFSTLSNANDTAIALGACAWDVAGAGGVGAVLAIDVTALITGSSRCAGVLAMGGRCDMAVLCERLHLNYRHAFALD